MKNSAAIMRRPIPLARSIRWDPVSAVPRVPGILEPVVFVTQGLVREVARHLRLDPEQELLGFLFGELFECPETGTHYVVLFAASRTGYAIPEAEPVPIPEEQWLGVQLEARRRRIPLAGWYHSVPFVGVHPARPDVETQRVRFPEPFQCGLVMTTEGSAPAGGFYRALPTDGGVFIPFHELLDDDAILAGGHRRSVIQWENYRTNDLVEYEDERVAHAEPPIPSGLQETAPRDTASRNTMQLPVIIPSPARTGEVPIIPAPLTHRVGFGALSLVLLAAIAVGLVLFVWSQRDLTGPPTGSNILAQLRNTIVGSSTNAAPTNAPPTNAPSANAPSANAPSASTVSQSDSASLAELPVDSLPHTVADTTTPNATMGAAQPQSPQPQSPQTAQPRAMQPAPSTTPATADAGALTFDSIADSLVIAIRNFHVRSSDFSQKRISCSTLATGYRGADDAFISLATAYRAASATLDSRRVARYQGLSGQMDTVNKAFDESRCERP